MPSRPMAASTVSPTLSPPPSRTFFGMVTWNFGPTLTGTMWSGDIGQKNRREMQMISRVRLLGVLFLLATPLGVAVAGSLNGSAGDMPAYYDGQLFTINFTELPPVGEAAALAQNKSINIIYMCDACEGALPGGSSFVSVIDAIQADGFNPLWQEVQITFNAGFAPRQLTSDVDVEAAANAGEITLTPTTEVYRCSVVGTNL